LVVSIRSLPERRLNLIFIIHNPLDSILFQSAASPRGG
jgi:hypothetical protein